MAEGGGEFAYEDPDIDNQLDHDDDGEQEVDRTQPFQPGAASTPYQPGASYHGGEQTEMRTIQHEQSGLPDTSYQEEEEEEEETPFFERTPSIGDLQKESYLVGRMRKAIKMIKTKFPKAEKIRIRRGTGKNAGKIVAVVVQKGEYKIVKDGYDDEPRFMKTF